MKTKQHISVAAGIGGIVRAGAVALVTCFSALAAEARTDAITCTISPERAVLQSGKPESAVVKVAMKGGKASGEKERPSVNLAIVLDLFNREVVGWSLKPRMTADIGKRPVSTVCQINRR